MAGLGQLIFGNPGSTQPVFISTPSQPAPAAQPTPPKENDAAVQEAQRQALAAQRAAMGRGATILTDYALATTAPSVLKKTLGGA